MIVLALNPGSSSLRFELFRAPAGGDAAAPQRGAGGRIGSIGSSGRVRVGRGRERGLVMATRSGDVDPALVAFLARAEDLSAQEVVLLLNERSGCSESPAARRTCARSSGRAPRETARPPWPSTCSRTARASIWPG